jgi:hypothetical protein
MDIIVRERFLKHRKHYKVSVHLSGYNPKLTKNGFREYGL